MVEEDNVFVGVLDVLMDAMSFSFEAGRFPHLLVLFFGVGPAEASDSDVDDLARQLQIPELVLKHWDSRKADEEWVEFGLVVEGSLKVGLSEGLGQFGGEKYFVLVLVSWLN